jgi:predicted secreted protein
MLDEDEQRAVVDGFQREADRSAAIFRFVFTAISGVLALAVVYLVLKSGPLRLSTPPAFASSAAGQAVDGPRVLASIGVATQIVLHAAAVFRFRPRSAGSACSSKDQGAGDATLAVVSSHPGVSAVARSRFVRLAVVQALLCLLYFVVYRSDWELYEALWWVWPVGYHVAAALCIGWMQEVQDGIEHLDASRYHFKSA